MKNESGSFLKGSSETDDREQNLDRSSHAAAPAGFSQGWLST